MDAIEIVQPAGDRSDPARLRITHDDRVLDVGTRFQVLITPRNRGLFAYPAAIVSERPPVRCYLYDWLQYINFSLQRQFGNILTAKESQLPTLDTFDVYPARQASYCTIQEAAWEPEYTDLPPQTAELYNLLDALIKLPDVEFEDQDIVTFVRITSGGDVRITAGGDRRIVKLLDSEAAQLPA